MGVHSRSTGLLRRLAIEHTEVGKRRAGSQNPNRVSKELEVEDFEELFCMVIVAVERYPISWLVLVIASFLLNIAPTG